MEKAEIEETPSLDPSDWEALRAEAHRAVDDAIAHLRGRQDRPVWQPLTETDRAAFASPLPRAGTAASDLATEIRDHLMAHDLGNTHGRFFGWVHGTGTAQGILPAIYEAAINANLGGRDHAPILAERAITGWMRALFGFPGTASGLVVSGTSMATLIALKTARDRALGIAARADGLGGRPLVGYCSTEAHGCVAKAFDILGLGSAQLNRIATDDRFCIRPDALLEAIAADRAAGRQPFLIVGTAGAVNTGATDDLSALAGIAQAEGLWLHVDGAFGALAMLAPDLAPRLAGIERADSLALDFHKWLHVTYDAGMVLIRDGEAHARSFSDRPDYLAASERGCAGGNPWPCEFGPELSRGFRALKVWYQLRHFGLDRLGEKIAENCAQARHLEALLRADPVFEVTAPAQMNIVCFRYAPAGAANLDRLNGELVIRLQESGLAVPSTTRIHGALSIRVNITNHRTRMADMDILVAACREIGQAVLAESAPPARGVPTGTPGQETDSKR